ncbi:MAG: hypothetical protein K2P94_15300 [Rhodospirillaceae bacterium]|nr:hypothetical protein [Rhodospirillaceae bacterium]
MTYCKTNGFLAALIIASGVAVSAHAEEKPEAPYVVVFEYQKNAGAQGSVDPLFILQDGKPGPLPFEGRKGEIEKTLGAFAHKEYPVGRVLRVFEGGQLLRGVAVDSGLDDMAFIDANPILSSVNVRDAGVVLHGSEYALATNTPYPSTLDFRRRPLNTDEHGQVMAAARRIYAQDGLPPAVIADMKIERAESYSSADRGSSLVFASLTTATSQEKPAEHERALFLILKKSAGDKFNVAYHNVTPAEGPERKAEEIVDLFDIDKDGAPEAITRTHYWESWEYNIRRENGGAWDIIYTGAADGV